MINKNSIKMLLVLISTLTLSANAATFQLSGEVTSSTNALAELFPAGSLVFGPVVIDTAAVDAGFAVASDITSLDINLGEFCFSTQASPSCPNGGVDVPVTMIDYATFSFVNGVPTGGNLFLWFSPLSGVALPLVFDLSNGVFAIEAGDVGTLIGNATLDASPIPIPAAIWLMGSALLGLIGLRRHR